MTAGHAADTRSDRPQRVERLQHEDAEHQNRIIGRTAAAAAVAAWERSFDFWPEQLEVEHGAQPFQRVSRRRQRRQSLIRVKETRLLPHPRLPPNAGRSESDRIVIGRGFFEPSDCIFEASSNVQGRNGMVIHDKQAMTSLAGSRTQADAVIVFDGRCGFCARTVATLLRILSSHRVYACSSRSQKAQAIGPLQARKREVFAFITATTIATDVDAYIAILSMGPQGARLAGRALAFIPRVISNAAYELIASNRAAVSRLTGLRGFPKLVSSRMVDDGV